MNQSLDLIPAALDFLNEGLLVLDTKLNVVHANKVFTGLFGAFSPGIPLAEAYPDLFEVAGTNLQDALRGRRSGFLDVKTADDGTYRELSIELKGVRIGTSSISHCLCVVYDKTRLSAQNREMLSRLAAMNLQLGTARRYQAALFTDAFSDENLSCQAVVIPAMELSGDFFHLSKNHGHYSFVLGDVQGHGIDVAMKAIALQQLVRITLEETSDVAEVMQRMNSFVCQDQLDRFWTCCLFIGHYDQNTRELLYSRAGIPEPVLLRSDGELTTLSRGDMPLGYFEEETYQCGKVNVESGDRILLFSDGVTESAIGENNSLLGLEGLIRLYKLELGKTTGHIVEQLNARLEESHNGSGYVDDVTLAEAIFN